jgi:hypothetical protein
VMILFKLQAYSFVDLKGYDEWNWLWIAQSWTLAMAAMNLRVPLGCYVLFCVVERPSIHLVGRLVYKYKRNGTIPSIVA